MLFWSVPANHNQLRAILAEIAAVICAEASTLLPHAIVPLHIG
jgi:hypothetical protein